MDLPIYSLYGQREYYRRGLDGTFEFQTANELIIDYCIDLYSVSLHCTSRLDSQAIPFALAASPLGSLIASGLQNGSLELWDIDSGKSVYTIHRAHSEGVTACTFTPDGMHLISAPRDKTLKLWNIHDRACQTTLIGHKDVVNACAVTPDGCSIFSASADWSLIMWDIEKSKPVMFFEGHENFVNDCAVLRDGSKLISASEDKSVKVWSVTSGKCEATLKGHKGEVNACAVTPDGLIVVSGSMDKTLKLWDVRNLKCVGTLEGHTRDVWTCNITCDGLTIISTSPNELLIWNLNSQELAVRNNDTNCELIISCTVAPSDVPILTGYTDNSVRLWKPLFEV